MVVVVVVAIVLGIVLGDDSTVSMKRLGVLDPNGKAAIRWLGIQWL